MDAPVVTVAVAVTTEGAGGVIYADEDELALVEVALVPFAKALNAEKEWGSGSAGALTKLSWLQHQ